MKKTSDIYWWENEISHDDRTRLMGNYSWHGTVEQRHKKLHEMRQKYNKEKKVYA